jgi:hypothetical protein
VREFADTEGVRFLDPTGGDPSRFGATPYADLSHMTADGSEEFTRELAMQMSPIVAAALGTTPAEGQTLDVIGLNRRENSTP